MVDVCLVSMPFASLERPSIGISLLSSSAESDGLRTRCVYPVFEFARQIGLELYRAIADHGDAAELLGEWIFAAAAFPEHGTNEAEYLDYVLREDYRTLWQLRAVFGEEADLRELLRSARTAASRLVAEVSCQVLALQPRIVGCTSVFQQHCASIALLRTVKASAPSTVTMLGGGNCEGVMADVAARSFPWLDYVVSGEADLIFPRLCRLSMEYGADIPRRELPRSVRTSRGHSLTVLEDRCSEAREQVDDVDDLPVPRYADYFETLAGHSELGVSPTLLIETSRGCWYGQKRHCTFCGLNGMGMKFRSKSPDRVLGELAELSDTYGRRDFEAVDNILNYDYFHTLLPRLASDPTRRYRLFFETKANLREHHVALLADAGVRTIQPGIESFHDGPLKLSDKGNSAGHNVELLVLAAEYGVKVNYNLLYGFPGEDEGWYIEMARWLPRIVHLQPPVHVGRIRYDRFSPYHREPERFGIRLEPNRSYRHVYPLPAGELADLAYFFEDYSDTERGYYGRRGYSTLWELWARWHEVYDAHRRTGKGAMLMAVEEDEETTLLDRRPGAAEHLVELRGLPHHLHRLCRRPQPRQALYRLLSGEAPDRINAACEELLGAGYIVDVCGQLVTIAPRATQALLARES